MAFVALVCLGTGAQAQQTMAGVWRGYWIKAGDSLPVDLTILADSGRYRAAFSSERLRVSGIPFGSVETNGCCDVTMTLRGDRTTTVFTGRMKGDSLTGLLREGGDDGRFEYARIGAGSMLWREESVTFRNGDVALAGTLLLPLKGPPSSAVVFLHGSGAESRWASRFLAEHLVQRGVAALIYDKRGVGSSTGDWRRATPDDLIADARAAVQALANNAAVGNIRIGAHGHSQGGTLIPMLASTEPRLNFIIASAATGIPTDSTEIFSVLNSILIRARTAKDSAAARDYVGELVGVAYRGEPRALLDALVAQSRGEPWFFTPPADNDSYWFFSKSFGAYEPLTWWSKVRVPTLLLYGEADARVPGRESAARISSTLRRAGNEDVTVKIFPGADHTFRLAPGPSGWPRTAPAYLSTIDDWITQNGRK